MLLLLVLVLLVLLLVMNYQKKLKSSYFRKNLRIAQETSEANSGVIHGGFDPTPGKLNAKLNLEGRKLYEND